MVRITSVLAECKECGVFADRTPSYDVSLEQEVCFCEPDVSEVSNLFKQS
jgi:hypothetical protein